MMEIVDSKWEKNWSENNNYSNKYTELMNGSLLCFL